MLAIFSTFLLLLGIILTMRGFRPPRIGTELRCRRCDYQLQGITSDRCPECGSELTPANRVVGRRQRGPITATFGVILLLLGIAGGTIIVTHVPIDWYRYRPTNWVIDDIAAPNSIPNLKAWNEIHRRMLAGGFSPAQRDRLADQCLATLPSGISPIDPAWVELMAQDAADTLGDPQRQKLIDWALKLQLSTAPSSIELPMDWLNRQNIAVRLTPAQRETYFSHLMRLTFKARAFIEEGADLPYLVSYIGRGPETGIWYSWTVERLTIDDQPVRTWSNHNSADGLTGSGSRGSFIEYKRWPISPGSHRLQMAIKMKYFEGHLGPQVDESRFIPAWEHTEILNTSFKVLENGQSDPLISVSDQALLSQFQQTISAGDLSVGQNGKDMSLTINCQRPPMDYAFDIFAIVDGKEHRLGSIAGHQNENMGNGVFCDPDFELSRLTTLDLVLRTSEPAAKNSVDIVKIWKGELKLTSGPFRVQN